MARRSSRASSACRPSSSGTSSRTVPVSVPASSRVSPTRSQSGRPVTLYQRGRVPHLNPVFVDDAADLTQRALIASTRLVVNCAGNDIVTVRELSQPHCGDPRRDVRSSSRAVIRQWATWWRRCRSRHARWVSTPACPSTPDSSGPSGSPHEQHGCGVGDCAGLQRISDRRGRGARHRSSPGCMAGIARDHRR